MGELLGRGLCYDCKVLGWWGRHFVLLGRGFFHHHLRLMFAFLSGDGNGVLLSAFCHGLRGPRVGTRSSAKANVRTFRGICGIKFALFFVWGYFRGEEGAICYSTPSHLAVSLQCKE